MGIFWKPPRPNLLYFPETKQARCCQGSAQISIRFDPETPDSQGGSWVPFQFVQR